MIKPFCNVKRGLVLIMGGEMIREKGHYEGIKNKSV